MLQSAAYLENIEPLAHEKIYNVAAELGSQAGQGNFGGRASSLPKIGSRVKLAQHDVLGKQDANSRAAMAYKHLSNMDH